jgi:NADH dehydrogenase
MAETTYDSSRLVAVFGGSGFLGRHIVTALARNGWRVRVAVRRPDLAAFLKPIGGVGQIQAVQSNLRYPASIAAALEGVSMVVNAAGIRSENGAQTYSAVHVDGAGAVARAAAAAGVGAYVHISGIGADPKSRSPYIASKGLGEIATRDGFPAAAIFRPSVVFGPEDDFFNRFAALARILPVLPLLGGGEARLQPVYAGDVARAAASALGGPVRPGAVYELGGPQIMTLRQAASLVLRSIERRSLLIGLPPRVSRWIAAASEFASKATFGLYPQLLTMTRDQVDLLASDNVVSADAEAEGRVLRGLGVEPQAAEAIIGAYLVRFRKTGQYEVQRSS